MEMFAAVNGRKMYNADRVRWIMRWFTRGAKCAILKDNARAIKEQINEVVECNCSLL